MSGKDGSASPIIIKRIKKGGHGGHHGGAWKVAYADFVTAMMAFFLLLWLLNVTTDIERKGIADYFAPISISSSSSGAGGLFGGLTMSDKGAQMSDTSPIGASDAAPQPDESGNDREESPGSGQPEGPVKDQKGEVKSGPATLAPKPAADAESQKKAEEESFKKAETALRETIKSVPDLADLEKNLIIDSTPEGLRIQIVDRDGYSLFATGSAILAGKSRRLVSLVGMVLRRLPNKITITGHTDNTPFPRASRRNNWQLSAERAQSSLTAIMAAGVPQNRVRAIIGKADREPLVKDDPKNPQNRRISIVLLRRAYMQQLMHGGSSAYRPPPAAAAAPSAPASAEEPFSSPSREEEKPPPDLPPNTLP